VNGIDNTPNDALDVFMVVLADVRVCAEGWGYPLEVNAIRAPNRSQEP
jgi:hypothetical protein